MGSSALDTAQLELVNWTNGTLYFYRQFVDCYECPLIQTAVLPFRQTVNVSLNTIYNQQFAVTNLNVPYLVNHQQAGNCLNLCSDDCFASGFPNLADQGQYRLTINNIGHYHCELETLEHGRNNFYPFVASTLLYVALLCGVHFGARFIQQRWCSPRRASPDGLPTNETTDSSSSVHQALRGTNSGRFSSIDAFRGITILLMIFVNYGAGEYHWLQHAPWDGLHLADVVFPFFIFIMGTSIAVGFKNLTLRSSISPGKILVKIAKRSANLFILGLIVNSIGSGISTDFSTLRIPGVLQRFALSYGVVASVHLLSITIPKRCSHSPFLQKLFRYFPLWPEYSLALLMTAIYGYFTFFWQYDENCPVGYLGPGGLYGNMYFPYCTGGAARKIDEIIFTSKHSYKGFFGSVLYDPGRKMKLWHDPEGLLGTTTSIVLTLIGLQVGHILVYNHEPWAKFRKWFFMTLSLAALTKFCILVFSIPINKNLWSFTFITLTGCFATVLLSAFHFLIDIRNDYYYWPEGWPLHFAGQNSILLYMGHEIAHDMFPFTFSVSGTLLTVGGHVGFLLRNLIGTTIWLLISVWLAKRQIFLTV